MNQVELHDSRGQFKMPAADVIATFDKPTRALWDAVAKADAAVKAAQTNIITAKAHVDTCTVNLADTEQFLKAFGPEPTR